MFRHSGGSLPPVLEGVVQHLHGWTFASTLALLGVYLLLSALRGLVFEPSFYALAGMNGEIWKGTFDFTLLRPVPVQFMVSFRRWNIYALFDLLYGLGCWVSLCNNCIECFLSGCLGNLS